MATKQFAIPLDDNSQQTGDINFEKLRSAETDAEFRLTNVGSFGSGPQLNLITSKGGSQTDHIFQATISSGTASTTLTHHQIKDVFTDADGGDWDYVEAEWTVGQVDTPSTSNLFIIQAGRTYNLIGWPPKR